jgi:hypothetical protein
MLTMHRNMSVQQDQQAALFVFTLLWLIACTCFEDLFAHNQEVLYIQCGFSGLLVSMLASGTQD